MLKPVSGETWLNNEKITQPKPIVGIAFQNPVLLEWRNILENVILPLEIVPNKLSQLEKEKRARSLLSLVGLDGFENRNYNSGMRQRASLCRAFSSQTRRSS